MGSDPSSPPQRDPIPIETREDARALLGRHVTFSEEWHYDIVLTWAAQGYLRGVLPDECCANLAFVGPKSSGKTTATQLSVLLAGGEMLASGTLAAMIRTFETAGVVGIDELDSNLKKEENLEGILRVGNKWSAVYKICMPGARGAQRAVDLKIGGPKVFNFRSEIEDALRTRTYVVEMPRQDETGQIVRNLFLDSAIRPVGAWLRSRCESAVAGWTPESVKGHMLSDGFLARIRSLPASLARHRQTAAVLLAVDDILGWNLDDEIRGASEAQADDEGTNELLRDALTDLYTGRAAPFGSDEDIPLVEALQFVNLRLKESGAPTLSDKAFARARREFGFRDRLNVLKVRSERGRRILRFDATVRNALGIGPPPIGLETPVVALATPPPGSGVESEIERAVREFGPTVTYPDGTIADRRTGAVLRGAG
jgi:hypothetical protein